MPERLRELAILVTARHWRQPYEWLAHVGPALKAGVSVEALDRLAEGEDPARLLTAQERVVHGFVSQTHSQGEVDDATFAAARDLLGERGVVELLGLCGYYAMLAMVMNVSRTSCADRSFPVHSSGA